MLLFAKTLRTFMTLWRRNDILKFDADAILFREIQCNKRDILVQFRLKSGKICNNMESIALTLAGSHGRFMNTRPDGLVFKQLPWDAANMNY